MAATRDASEMVVSMAALILQDEKMDISPENINKILEAAGASVEPYWPKLFCQALSGVDVGSLMTAVSSAPAPVAGAAAGGAAPAAAAAPAEKAKEEEPEEEEEDDMGFSLFD